MDHSYTSDVEPTLADLLSEIWQGKLFVAIGTVLGLVIAAVFLMSALPHAKAKMVISPAASMKSYVQSTQGQQGELQAVTPSLPLDFMRFESVLKGESVALALLRDEKIVQGLRQDRAFKVSEPEAPLSPSKLSVYLQERIHIEQIGQTPLRILSYEHQAPQFAAYFVQQLHRTADRLLRFDRRKQVEERIAYLEQEIGKTRYPEHRRALTDLLIEQERSKMLVSIDQPFAAAIVEPSSALPKQSWPDVPLVMFIGGCIGAFLGYIVYMLSLPKKRNAQGEGSQQTHKSKMREWVRQRNSNTNDPPLTEHGHSSKSAAE